MLPWAGGEAPLGTDVHLSFPKGREALKFSEKDRVVAVVDIVKKSVLFCFFFQIKDHKLFKKNVNALQ